MRFVTFAVSVFCFYVFQFIDFLISSFCIYDAYKFEEVKDTSNPTLNSYLNDKDISIAQLEVPIVEISVSSVSVSSKESIRPSGNPSRFWS